MQSSRQNALETKLLWPGGTTCLKEVSSPITSMPASWARSSEVSVMRMPWNLNMSFVLGKLGLLHVLEGLSGATLSVFMEFIVYRKSTLKKNPVWAESVFTDGLHMLMLDVT
ncbi:hypothetical protein DPMN_070197 [Dreissena polymorpha]|uniref:Uncharacterized protein n=1 Tax=Dreissena polymorpha TaxID=45954 RepID=A0A9D4BUY2_DREPO|nr:hypothetical protein DPMN_070118 [Dreissena polymorpha]KAH3710705.1 hypothetical protein DPMN_070197 [Dreissena polymorpha]